MKRKSVYERIISNLIDGKLPDGFIVEEDYLEGSNYCLAEGLRDYICLYQQNPVHIPDDYKEVIESLFERVKERKLSPIMDTLMLILSHYRTVEIRQEVCIYVVEETERENLLLRDVFDFAMHLMLFGEEIEHVKFGMNLLSLINSENNEKVKEVVKVLSKCEELALFACEIFAFWSNAEEELLELAKCHEGYGRIFAIYYLEPTKEETKQWLLQEGCFHRMSGTYTALDCYVKGDMYQMLTSEHMWDCSVSYGYYSIMEALLKEGVREGLSTLGNGPEVLSLFLDKAYQEPYLEIEKLETIFEIYKYVDWKKESGEWAHDITNPIIDKSVFILRADAGVRCVQEALKEGKGIELAQALGVEVYAKLLDLLEADFDTYYFLTQYLMKQKEYVQTVIDIYSKKMDVENMCQIQRGDSVDEANERQDGKLIFCIQYLKELPGYGTNLLKAAVHSPIIQNRNMALTVLENWNEKFRWKLKKMDKELFKEICLARKYEPDESVRKRMDGLLNKKTLKKPEFLTVRLGEIKK